jgi:hypothetical protein
MTDELIVNSVSLDLSEKIPVPITFAIADVKDPSKRKQSFSKQVKLPDTMVNRAFFTGSFGLTVTENGLSFNATEKAEVILKKRGVQVLVGILKLDKVVVTNGNIDFICTVLSETVDLMQLLSTIMVNELDWSAYDHVLNRTNIKASWTTPIGSGYYYPLIERGNGRLGATIWRTTDIMPYIYLREALEKALEWAGITWDSNFLDTDMFKSILFGYGGGDIRTISASDQSDRKVEIDNLDFNASIVQNGGTIGGASSREYSFSLVGGNIVNPFSDAYSTYTVTQDIFNQFEDGEISIQKTGNYNIAIAGVLDYALTYANMTLQVVSFGKIRVYKNGLLLTDVNPTTLTATTDTGVITFNSNFNLSVQTGDVISFMMFFGGAKFLITPYQAQEIVQLDLTTNTPFTVDMTSIDTTITDGATVRLHNYIPAIPCSELLLGCIRQFNLYQSDPDEYGVRKIEPATDFYTGTNVFKDISQEVDQAKAITIRPSANEYAKNIIYKFKDSTDYDATQYFDKWKNKYGDLSYTQGSYYAKGDNKTELPWSTIVPYQVAPNIIVPRYIKVENNGTVKQNAGAPRIMFRNGLKTGSWTLRDTVGTASEVLTTYPCVHHFDNYTNPTMDLNFRLVDEVFYTTTVVTTKNCYSEYYSVFINEMTSPAGQLVTCSVKWDEQTIKARDFGKFLMINGGLFRLNAIKEFSADVEASTEIELVKVLKARKNRRFQITRPPYVNILGVGDLASPEGVGGDTGVIVGGFGQVNGNSKIIRG